MKDVSSILNNASSYSLVIADEVGRGTSTHDGYALAYATLEHLVKHSQYYHMLGKEVASEVSEEVRKNIGIYDMATIMDKQRKDIIFLHKFQQGISTSSRGIYCARLAGVPSEVADAAEVAAEKFEREQSLWTKVRFNQDCCIIENRSMLEVVCCLRSTLETRYHPHPNLHNGHALA